MFSPAGPGGGPFNTTRIVLQQYYEHFDDVRPSHEAVNDLSRVQTLADPSKTCITKSRRVVYCCHDAFCRAELVV